MRVCACVCRNSVRLVIRKVQYAPEKPGPQPMVETTRSFLMSDRSLHLEASLDKEVHTYTHTHTVHNVVEPVISRRSSALNSTQISNLSSSISHDASRAAVLPWRAHQRQRPRHQQLHQNGQESQDLWSVCPSASVRARLTLINLRSELPMIISFII